MTVDNVWHVRGGYSFPLHRETYIELVIMYTRFDGDVASMTYLDSIDHQLDIGVNWYIRHNTFKVSARGQIVVATAANMKFAMEELRADFSATRVIGVKAVHGPASIVAMKNDHIANARRPDHPAKRPYPIGRTDMV
jgi:hypothetical protein